MYRFLFNSMSPFSRKKVYGGEYPDSPYPLLDSGEFCEQAQLNAREYPRTLWLPTASVRQKGYPLAQAHCTAFTQAPVVFVCPAVTPFQTTMAARRSPSRCVDCVRNTAHNDRQSVSPHC